MKKTLLTLIVAALFIFPTIPAFGGDGHIDSPGATCVNGHIDSPGVDGHIDSPGLDGHIDSPGIDCKVPETGTGNSFSGSNNSGDSAIDYIQALIAEYNPFKFL